MNKIYPMNSGIMERDFSNCFRNLIEFYEFVFESDIFDHDNFESEYEEFRSDLLKSILAAPYLLPEYRSMNR